MNQVIIENPILKSRFEEPKRHFTLFDEDKGKADRLIFIVEVSGQGRIYKAAKVATARTLWMSPASNDGQFGRRTCVEIADPWDARRAIMKGITAC